MLNKYFLPQIAEKNLHFALKEKVKIGIRYYPSSGEIKLKLAAWFFKPTTTFCGAEMKVVGNRCPVFSKYVSEID